MNQAISMEYIKSLYHRRI